MKYLMFLLLPSFVSAETHFSNETEASLVQTGGNSSVETYNAKTRSKWEAGKRIYSFSGHYTLGVSENRIKGTDKFQKIESARNWDSKFHYEQVLTNSLNGIFSFQYEGDIFSGFKQRENTDFGGKYILKKTNKTKMYIELGVRNTVEKKLIRDTKGKDVFNFLKGRIFYKVKHEKSKVLSYSFWVEYLPNFTEPDDYIITYEPSLAVVLSETFSLKTSYKAIYDNKPNIEGYKYTDFTAATSLIARF